MVKDTNKEYFVMFCGSNCFRDIQSDPVMVSANTNARAREGNGMDKNPLFQDGDLIYNGVIIREIPEIDIQAPVFYATAGAGGIPIAPVWMCGQSAMVQAWGQMPRPTKLKEDDYDFPRRRRHRYGAWLCQDRQGDPGRYVEGMGHVYRVVRFTK